MGARVGAVAERPRIAGDGTPAEDWIAHGRLDALPAVDAKRLVPSGARAVIVAAHPDDEVIGCGALLAQLARAGREIALVAVSDGEASHPGSSRWPPAALQAERPRETGRALAALGATPQLHRLGEPDGGLAARAADIGRRLDAIVRPGDVLVTHWRGDAHPDHEATASVAIALALRRALPVVEFPVWAWHWAEPRDARLPWGRARRLTADDAALARKARALACFASQLEPDAGTGRGPVVPASAVERACRLPEVFFL